MANLRVLKRHDQLLSVAVRPARVLTKWLRHLRRLDSRTLVVRPGGLGDLVVATAVVSDLGVSMNRTHWLIERRSEPWAKYLSLSYSLYDRLSDPLKMYSTTQFAQVVILEQLFGLAGEAGVALVADPRNSIGFTTNRSAKQFGSVHDYDPLHSHELAEFARPLGSAFSSKQIPVGHRKRAFSDEGTSIIAIAGGNAESRKLKAADWVNFASKSATERMLVVADRPDEAMAIEVTSRLGIRNRPLVGDFNRICNQVRHATRVLTIDGGMVHVASYFGVPVDAIFTAGRERKWGPWSKNSRVYFGKDVDCRPCTMFGQVPPCPNHYICKDPSRWHMLDA